MAGIGGLTGAALTGIASAKAGGIGADLMLAGLKDVQEAFKNLGKLMKDVLGPVVKGVTETFGKLGSLLKDAIVSAAGNVARGFHLVTDTLGKLGTLLMGAVVPAVENVSKGFRLVADTLGPVVASIADKVRIGGGAVAGAVGGIFGKAIERISPVAEVFGNTVAKGFGKVAEKVEPFLKPLTQGIGTAFAKLGDVEGLLKPLTRGVTQSLGGLGKAVGGMAAGFGAAVGGAVAMGQALGDMVAKASPATFQKFQLALSDLAAVAGAALVPAFDLITEVVRAAGDTLTTFSSSIGSTLASVMRPIVDVLKVFFDVFGRVAQMVSEVVAKVAPAFEGLGQALLSVFQAIQPVINLLIDGLGGALGFVFGMLGDAVKAITPPIIAFAGVIEDGLKTVTKWIRELLSFIGIELKEGAAGTKPGASVGAAVTSVGHGSVESMIQKAQQSAFSLGKGADDPAKKTASAAEAMKTEVEKIRTFIEKLPTLLAELPGKLALAIRDGAVEEVRGAFRSPMDLANDKLAAAGLVGQPTFTDDVRDAVDRALAAAARLRPGGDGGGTVGGDF